MRRAKTHDAIDPMIKTMTTEGTSRNNEPRYAQPILVWLVTVETLVHSCQWCGNDMSGMSASAWDFPAVTTTVHRGIPTTSTASSTAPIG